MGMVGGGEGAFIGEIHRLAALMDGQIELVCGAFSSDPERGRRSGEALTIPPERCYDSYQTMMRTEAGLAEDKRMDFVVIVTPNHLHFPVAMEAIKHGFHVLSDKPATLNVSEVLALRECLEQSSILYGLTHTYTGYPMIKEARARVQAGALGTIRKVQVEYPQGWLAAQEESAGNKQAQWRLDPKQAGISGCMADIGVHAFNLVEYVTGLEAEALCADLNSFVPGRLLDDDGAVIIKFKGGAKGVLTASQIAIGEENNLRLRVYGDAASLDWCHEDPNSLMIKANNAPTLHWRTGSAGVSEMAQLNTRTPAGHPEGYLEAFANIYKNFAGSIQAQREQRPTTCAEQDVPGIEEAVRGMVFIESVVASSNSQEKWYVIPEIQQEKS